MTKYLPVRIGEANTLKVDIPLPKGDNAFRVVATNRSGTSTTFNDIATWDGTRLRIFLPADYAVVANFPASLAVQVSTNGGTFNTVETVQLGINFCDGNDVAVFGMGTDGVPRRLLTDSTGRLEATQHGTWTVAHTAGTTQNFVTTASTNSAVDRNTAASLYELTVSNPTASMAVVKFYNKATAPTVGTDVPVLTIPVASNSFVSVPFGTLGKRFSAGIGRAVTAGLAASDSTATVAGIQVSYTWSA